MSSPAEFTWTWDRYRKLFLEEKRISNGKKFIRDNSDLFNRVEDEFGVPREIITSILGVETRYGKIKGSYRVLDSNNTPRNPNSSPITEKIKSVSVSGRKFSCV